MIKEVLKIVPNIGYSVSFTTRKMRGTEQNGRDYFFVGKAQFEELIRKDEFLEFAEVHGNFYGTSMSFAKAEIDSGRDVVLEIDVQGAESVRKKFPEAVSIFILPPSFEVLQKRLTARATEKKADLDLRLKNSFREVKCFEEFEYIVVNNEVTKATNDLRLIILADRLKRIRQSNSIKAILDSFDASSAEKYIAGD